VCMHVCNTGGGWSGLYVIEEEEVGVDLDQDHYLKNNSKKRAEGRDELLRTLFDQCSLSITVCVEAAFSIFSALPYSRYFFLFVRSLQEKLDLICVRIVNLNLIPNGPFSPFFFFSLEN